MGACVDVGILVFDHVEILDMAGPYEAFSVAARVAKRAGKVKLDVFTISVNSVNVRCRGGLRLLSDKTITQHAPAPDIVIVPGGIVDEQARCATTMEWLRGVSHQGRIVSSVCNGALILAAAGLLDGRRATTHWEDVELLREAVPSAIVAEDCRFVDDGNVVTSGGVTAGIDMSLHLIQRFYGSDLAHLTARQMDYVWHLE